MTDCLLNSILSEMLRSLYCIVLHIQTVYFKDSSNQVKVHSFALQAVIWSTLPDLEKGILVPAMLTNHSTGH